MKKRDLTGKIAIITGASGGIGRAMAIRLADSGMNLVLSGTKGSLELKTYYSGDEPGCTITIYEPSGEKRIIIPSQRDSRGHGSADVMFRDAMFRGLESDPMNQVADSRAAAMSIGIGFAATTSMDEDRAVEMKELFEDL